MADFNHRRAIEDYTELMRRVSVGAYTERSAEDHLLGIWPSDGIEESIHTLEEIAAKNGLEFAWHEESGIYALEPMSHETKVARGISVQLSPSVTASIDENGVVSLADRHPLASEGARFVLDAGEAWNLLTWLTDNHRDRLYQLAQHGKSSLVDDDPVIIADEARMKLLPVDSSFLEFEDEGGDYRIVGVDEQGQNIKKYLAPGEIVMPTVCPYCLLAECICEERSTFTLQEALASGARKFIAKTGDEKATLTIQEGGYIVALQDKEHEFGLIFFFETPEELLADETVQRAANWNWQAAEQTNREV